MENQIKQLWDSVAVNYGQKGPKYWDEFGEKLVDLVSPVGNERILDIGSGRGATLFALAKKLEKGKIIGIDVSTEMVKFLNQDIQTKNIRNACVFCEDINDLSFNTQSFDIISSGFCLASFIGNKEVFSKVLSWVKEGGYLLISSWGNQLDQEWLTLIINRYLEVEKAVKDSPEESILSNINNNLESYPLENVQISEVEETVNYSSKNQWWSEMESNAVKPILQRIEQKGPGVYKKFKDEVNNALESFKMENQLRFRMNVIYLRAQVRR